MLVFLQVVWLSLSPVEPLHGLVSGGPEPLPGVMLAVSLLQVRKSVRQPCATEGGSYTPNTPYSIHIDYIERSRDQTYIGVSPQPELSELSHVSDGEKLSFQPVVDSCRYWLYNNLTSRHFDSDKRF